VLAVSLATRLAMAPARMAADRSSGGHRV